jgi:flagellar basal-body rod modification protein FlgD
MSDLNIGGIRTTADLRAEAAAPKPEADLDRNAFLRLFTTQLQNQNPLDPMKNEAFVAQLAQFSSLEATTRMSDSLDQFVSTQSSEKIMRGASLIGKKRFRQWRGYEPTRWQHSEWVRQAGPSRG